MEDTFSKYLRLLGNIFFTFVVFIIAMAIILFSLRLMFGLLDQLPWFTYLYMLLMLLIPGALFISVLLIYFIRTKSHPSKVSRIVSYVIFSMLLLTWGVFLVIDLGTFFKNGYSDIGKYYSYNLLFLVVNVGSIFFTGVFQALSTQKEKDWMEKHLQ